MSVTKPVWWDFAKVSLAYSAVLSELYCLHSLSAVRYRQYFKQKLERMFCRKAFCYMLLVFKTTGQSDGSSEQTGQWTHPRMLLYLKILIRQHRNKSVIMRPENVHSRNVWEHERASFCLQPAVICWLTESRPNIASSWPCQCSSCEKKKELCQQVSFLSLWFLGHHSSDYYC